MLESQRNKRNTKLQQHYTSRDWSKNSTTRSGQKRRRINGFCKNNGDREINKRNRRTDKPDAVSK